MPCYSPIKCWFDAETNRPIFKATPGSREGEVSCRGCLGCRLDNARVWSTRIVHEAALHESLGGNCFVTLTYREKSDCTPEQLEKGQHLPEDYSLNKSDIQRFFKRLRKRLSRHTSPELRKIKYFQVGEYGTTCMHNIDLTIADCPFCKLGRPHHHAMLFNFEPWDVQPIGQINGVTQWTSPYLEEIWGHGFVHVGDLNYQSAQYVTRYALKKITGPKSDHHYEHLTLEGELVYRMPEYRTHSMNLGNEWYEKYKSDFWPSDEVTVPGLGVIKKVPDCYTKLLKESDPFAHEEVLAKRVEYRSKNASDFTPQRLMDKYKVKKASLALKKGKTVQ